MMIRQISAKRLVTGVLVGFALLFTVACDNKDEIKAQISEQTPAGYVHLKHTVFKNKQKGTFNENCQRVSISCKVVISGTVDGKAFSKTITAELKQKGVRGAEYEMDCTDPVILQVPDDVRNIQGIMQSPDAQIPVDVIEGLVSVDLMPGVTLNAEPGYTLAILGFPAGMPDGTYDTTVGFDLDYSRPIDVKPIVTGKMVCLDSTYYPAFAPAGITDMADVPPVTIPVSNTPVPIDLPLDTLLDFVSEFMECGLPVSEGFGLDKLF